MEERRHGGNGRLGFDAWACEAGPPRGRRRRQKRVISIGARLVLPATPRLPRRYAARVEPDRRFSRVSA